MNRQRLLELSQVDITDIDKSALADIGEITIDKELPHEDRILSYIEQAGNPYCFVSGGVPVRMRFKCGDKSLSQSLANFFSQLKRR